MDRHDLQDTLPSETIAPPARTPVAEDLQKALAVLGHISVDALEVTPGDVLGEGGMGVVREAHQTSLGRRVAIKTLKATRRDPTAARDLLREAWVTGALEHPNVVPVHQLGIDEHGSPLLVLKRVDGLEWSKLIRDEAEVKRRFGVTDLLAWNIGILMQVLNAVRFAHSRGIIHRDLKPTNVMIGDFGEVYLLDWGIAVSLRPDPSGRLPLAADATEVAGTPCYMAPEMLEPAGKLSERTDVYLAGAVLFEIVAGKPPHEGTTALAVLSSVINSKPELPADAPSELRAICRRALAAEPDLRFESVEAVRLALQSYLEHRGSDLLVARARARLDDLAAILVAPADDKARHREEIYRLFGACRFGFHEALAVWKDNAAARTGLLRATIAVAEYELATNDAQTAVTLLSELDEPPPLLEQARTAAAAQHSRRAKLEQLRFTYDLSVGRVSRGRLGVTFGLIFTIAPLVLTVHVQNIALTVLWSLVGSLLTGLWVYLARDRLATTLVNRRLIGSLIFMFLAQAVLVICLWTMGVTIERAQVLLIFLYFVTAGCMALSVDRNLWPTAVGYLVAVLISARYPEIRLYAMSAGNFVLTLNALFSWRLKPDAATE